MMNTKVIMLQSKIANYEHRLETEESQYKKVYIKLALEKAKKELEEVINEVE